MPQLLTTRQFADHLGVVPETVRRWVRTGRLEPAGRTPTQQLRFHADQVREILEQPTGRATDISAHVQASMDKIRRLRREL